ncbi:MAG: hypothetical protein R2742_08630 [Micropruina glycogenica]
MNIGLDRLFWPASRQERVRLHRDAVPQGHRRLRPDQIDYLTADEEDRYVIAQANAQSRDRSTTEARVLVRKKHATPTRWRRSTCSTWTSRCARWRRWRPR